MNDYARYMRRQGFYVLNYFNVCEYRSKMQDKPIDVAKAAKDPELWKKPLAYPNNSHCINPSSWVDRQYLDYGPLLEVMHGRNGSSPHAVTVAGNEAKANLFRVPGGYAMPLTFAGKAPSVQVTLHGLGDITEKSVCEVLHPGRENPTTISVKRSAADAVLEVPIERGCAMVKIHTATMKVE